MKSLYPYITSSFFWPRWQRGSDSDCVALLWAETFKTTVDELWDPFETLDRNYSWSPEEASFQPLCDLLRVVVKTT